MKTKIADIKINERITITNLNVPYEGALYGTLVWDNPRHKKNFPIRFNTMTNKIICCQDRNYYISQDEGSDIWEIIEGKLFQGCERVA